MVRRRTIGFEARGSAASTHTPYFDGWQNGATVTTARPRTGSYGLQAVSNGIAQDTILQLRTAEILTGNGDASFIRVYFNTTSITPSANSTIILLANPAGATFASIRLKTTGELQLLNSSSTQIGSDSAALVADTWYRIEISFTLNTGGNDTVSARIDGVEFASGAPTGPSNTEVIGRVRLGWVSAAAAGITLYFDDFAWNDSSGTTQNSWPGEGKIVLLTPTSDNQVGDWTGGAGGVTNLWEALNNAPPVGTATETNTSQIENATNGGGTDYIANLTDYSTAGLTASDTINVVQAFVDTGEDAAANTKTGQFKLASNPAGNFTAFTFADDNGALGTWPNGWRCMWSESVDAPSVTLGTSPTIELDNTTASTDVVSVDSMGAYVDYQESEASVGGGLLISPRLQSQRLRR